MILAGSIDSCPIERLSRVTASRNNLPFSYRDIFPPQG